MTICNAVRHQLRWASLIDLSANAHKAEFQYTKAPM
jgi:hypothetical protein